MKYTRASINVLYVIFFFSSRRRHTRLTCDWSSDVCSSDLEPRERCAHVPVAVLLAEALQGGDLTLGGVDIPKLEQVRGQPPLCQATCPRVADRLGRAAQVACVFELLVVVVRAVIDERRGRDHADERRRVADAAGHLNCRPGACARAGLGRRSEAPEDERAQRAVAVVERGERALEQVESLPAGLDDPRPAEPERRAREAHGIVLALGQARRLQAGSTGELRLTGTPAR